MIKIGLFRLCTWTNKVASSSLPRLLFLIVYQRSWVILCQSHPPRRTLVLLFYPLMGYYWVRTRLLRCDSQAHKPLGHGNSSSRFFARSRPFFICSLNRKKTYSHYSINDVVVRFTMEMITTIKKTSLFTISVPLFISCLFMEQYVHSSLKMFVYFCNSPYMFLYVLWAIVIFFSVYSVSVHQWMYYWNLVTRDMTE